MRKEENEGDRQSHSTRRRRRSPHTRMSAECVAFVRRQKSICAMWKTNPLNKDETGFVVHLLLGLLPPSSFPHDGDGNESGRAPVPLFGTNE